jgi:ATP synthase protein I
MKMTDKPVNKPATEKHKKGDLIRYLGMASTVGVNMVISTFTGFALGYWVIDKYLNTQPWFTVLCTFLGIVAGFKYLFAIAKKAEEKNED